MSWSTTVAPASDGVPARSDTSVGPHWRLPPPTITMRTTPPSRHVAFAVQPAEQDGDGSRIVAELMGRSRDDAHLRMAVGVGHHAGVEVRHELVLRAVDHEQRP